MSRLEEIYSSFQLKGILTPTSPSAAGEAINGGAWMRNRTLAAACFTGGWTYLLDTDLTLSADEDVCGLLSSRLECRVFTMVCEGVSNTHGWALFAGGRKVRGFVSEGGEELENLGEPLPAEAGIDIKDVFEDEVLAVMKGTAVDFQAFWDADAILVGELEYVGPVPEMTPELQAKLAAKAREFGERLVLASGSGVYSKQARMKATAKAARRKEQRSRWKLPWRRG